MRAVGMAWQRRAGTQPADLGRCRQTQPADGLPGTGLEETQQPADQVGRPLRAVQVDGGSAVVLATQEAGSDLPNLSVSLPPIAFACHCLYPLP